MGKEKIMTKSSRKQLYIKLDYTKLWKLLIDKQRKKEDLKREAGVSAASVARLNKGENVNTETLLRICQYLRCDVADICEVKPIENDEVK